MTFLPALALAAPVQAQTAEGARLVVSPAGPYTTIAAALAQAQPGDTVEVRAGRYAGPLVVETAGVTLEGVAWPVIDGGGQGTVVTLAAPDVVFRGFEVRGSGSEPDRDHSGVTLTAPRVVVEHNRLEDVLFGIFVAQADGALVRGNQITGKAEYDLGRKGDGIRLWYSRDVIVEGNIVRETRDVVIWYSQGVTLRNNLIEHGRYGVHLMYCDDAEVAGNQLIGNSVGIYTMYSNRVLLRDNLVRGQRGPSGYALGFKDADDIEAVGNTLVDNRVGIFLDGTPFNPAAYTRLQANILAFNDVGVVLLPAVRGVEFAGNSFWENVEQVGVQGGGALAENEWRGNYWSDYAGFDADGDGRGDAPYRAERLFENLADRAPGLRALNYSPAAQAIEFTASAFPVVRPQPKLVDPEPLLQPLPVPASVLPPRRGSAPALAGAAAGLIALAALGLWRLFRAPNVQRSTAPMQRRETELRPSGVTAGAAVSVREVRKRYGSLLALAGVSFEAGAGEALALWGANGAGKTTLLKAMLGLIDFDGDIYVGGYDVRRAGKDARRQLGYVPQEAVFYDLSVQATMEFYARLKRVGPERIPGLLARLGLAAHAAKPVPALSGGLKQRLALALALLADPPVLLLDEPTASLDAEAQRDYLALLQSLRDDERKTILFASHRREEVEALATRVLSLSAGRLLESAPDASGEVDLALWVAGDQRHAAVRCLSAAGLNARLNGRGTVVVRAPAGRKFSPLQALFAEGIEVRDIEVERGGPWNLL